MNTSVRLVSRRRIVIALLSFVVSLRLVATCQAVEMEAFFHEDFNSGLNPNLFGYENFTLDNGVIRSNGLISDHNDRRYIRTVVSDYNTRDFRYDLTFTTTLMNEVSINYMGIGRGNRRTDQSFGYNEPWESLFFRIHTPNVGDGFVGVANHPVGDIVILGDIPNGGLHRARIEKIGKSITFSVDRNYNGVFAADMSHTFPNIDTVAPYLDDLNSRLFFGTAFPDDYFDDMLIAAIPEPNTAVLLVLCGLLALPRRHR